MGIHMRSVVILLSTDGLRKFSSSHVRLIYSVFFDNFFPNGWGFLNNFLHTYFTFISTLDDKFLFSYLQLWRSYAIL